MSGGHFDYIQFNIHDVAEDLERLIDDLGVPDEYGHTYDFSDDVVDEFREGQRLLKRAAIYLHRIDWLVSGDDGEEAFFRRLKEDLDEE